MNSKKILLIIFIVICIVGASIFCLMSNNSNQVLSYYYDGGDNVVVGGISFNVPDGFVEDENYVVINQPTDGEYNTRYSQSFFSNGTDDVLISVFYADVDITNFNHDYVDSSTTINGIEGYYIESDDGIREFAYLKDGKVVRLQSKSDNIFEKVI